MQTQENVWIQWRDFQDDISAAFESLRTDTDFTDVTLACQDGQMFDAHKIILSTSSPFFGNILRKNKHEHPLIYMRGIKSDDRRAIFDFLYYGEASVLELNLDSFHTIAQELHLKGWETDRTEEIKPEIKPEMKPEIKPEKKPKK